MLCVLGLAAGEAQGCLRFRAILKSVDRTSVISRDEKTVRKREMTENDTATDFPRYSFTSVVHITS